jgi:CheY-like chemotaxis protein
MTMKKRVLIVEDNPVIADAVAELVEESLDCDTLMDAQVDFGILDVEVADGLTYPLAARMMQHQIPFLFMSGSDPKKVPSELASAPFLRKPVPPDTLLTAAQRCL